MIKSDFFIIKPLLGIFECCSFILAILASPYKLDDNLVDFRMFFYFTYTLLMNSFEKRTFLAIKLLIESEYSIGRVE